MISRLSSRQGAVLALVVFGSIWATVAHVFKPTCVHLIGSDRKPTGFFLQARDGKFWACKSNSDTFLDLECRAVVELPCQ